MSYCKDCKDFMFYPNLHRCLPEWDVSDPEYDDTFWFKIRAFDEEEAATKGAEWLDMHNGEGPARHILLVKKTGNPESPSEWQISFEHEVTYRACQK